MQATWSEHHGEMARGVDWERHTMQQLITIASCCGGRCLEAVCKLLAQDHAGWTGGMPDLLLWRQVPFPTCRLVEVKGPRDRLSDQQRAWMRALHGEGVDVEVCKVLEPEKVATRKKAR